VRGCQSLAELSAHFNQLSKRERPMRDYFRQRLTLH